MTALGFDDIFAKHFGWCRKVSYAERDFPLDRDDLWSAAIESLWRASLIATESNLIQKASLIFFSRKAKLWAKHKRPKWGGGVVPKPLDHPEVADLVDPFSPEPWLKVAAAESYGRVAVGEAAHCTACGTKGGRKVKAIDQKPGRIQGLCLSCHGKRQYQKQKELRCQV